MNNINKILIIFSLSVSLFIVALSQFVQSEYFASFVLLKAQKSIQKKTKGKVNFSSIKLGVFPPSTTLENFSLESLSPKDLPISLNAAKLSVQFGLFDLFSNKLTIGRLLLSDGLIQYQNPTKGSTKKTNKYPKIKDVLSAYRDKIKKIPVKIKSIQLNGIDANIDDNSFVIDSLAVRLSRRSLNIKGRLETANIPLIREEINFNHDEISFDLELSRKTLKIKSFRVKDRLESASLSGKIFDRKKRYHFDGAISYSGELKKLCSLAKINLKPIGDIKGFVDASGRLQGNLRNLRLAGTISGQNITGPWGVADQVNVTAETDMKKVLVKDLSIKKNDGSAKLLQPVEIFDIPKNRLIPNTIVFQMNNLFSNDALYFKQYLNTAKGDMSGIIEITPFSKRLLVNVRENFVIKNFRLVTPKKEKYIISNKKIIIHNARLNILYGKYLDVNMDIEMPNSRIEGSGKLDAKGVNFFIKNSKIDLRDLGAILDIPVNGQGLLNMHIFGDYSDTRFKIEPDLHDFIIMDYHLGHVNGEMNLRLKDNSIHLKNIVGKRHYSKYKGSGSFHFQKKPHLDLNIHVERSSLEESFLLIKPVLNPVKRTFKDIKMEYSGDFHVRGEMKRNTIIVSGTTHAKSLFIRNENIDSTKASILYKNDILSVKNIKAKKSSGVMDGYFKLNFNNKKISYNAKFSNFKVKDFNSYKILNLSYDGHVNGTLEGYGYTKHHDTKLSLNITKGHIGPMPTEDSFFNLQTNTDGIAMEGNFLGKAIMFKSLLSFDGTSQVKVDVKTKDISILTSLLSEHNTSNTSITGETEISLDSTFNIQSPLTLSSTLKLKKFKFYKNNFQLKVDKNKNKIIVEKGKIKKWDIALQGKNDFFTSRAKGSIQKEFNVEQVFNLNPSLANIISPNFQSYLGRIQGKQIIVGKNGNLKHYLELESKNISAKIQEIPGTLSNINAKVTVFDNVAFLKKFESTYGDGKITGRGKVTLQFPFPILDLEFNMENSKITFLKRSHVIASGNLRLSGNKLPYLLSGAISLLHGDIEDEVKDIRGSVGSTTRYSRYAPQKNLYDKFEYIKYDLTLDALSPISIANGLIDIKMAGKCSIKGNLTFPLFNGQFNIVKGSSKFMFKNHSFILNEGTINLNDENRKSPPTIKFTGTSNINEYAVTLNVFGDINATNIEFSSDPPLSKEDILSLVTLGVTSDISKSLKEKDRQSITALSIGGLIVDQLRLQEGLTTSLGLRFGISPEFEEDDSSLLEDRTGSTKTSTSKIRTRTKIQIQKKMSNKVDLSLSSTVGESTDQKQGMNIIYNVNDNLSLEGVYEVRSSDDEEEEVPDSGGFDIKYRISF